MEVGLNGCPADAWAGPMGRRRSGGRDRRRGVRRRSAAREPARDVGSRVRRRRWRARTPPPAVSVRPSARGPARSASRVPVEGGRGPLHGSRSTAASSRQPLLEGAPGAGDVRRPPRRRRPRPALSGALCGARRLEPVPSLAKIVGPASASGAGRAHAGRLRVCGPAGGPGATAAGQGRARPVRLRTQPTPAPDPRDGSPPFRTSE